MRLVEEQKQVLQTMFTNFGWEINQFLDYMAQSNDFYFDVISQIKMTS